MPRIEIYFRPNEINLDRIREVEGNLKKGIFPDAGELTPEETAAVLLGGIVFIDARPLVGHLQKSLVILTSRLAAY